MAHRGARHVLPGIELATIRVLDQHAGTTGRLRLGLTSRRAPMVRRPVFVKLPPFDEAQRKMVAATDMGRREARFTGRSPPRCRCRSPLAPLRGVR